MVITVLVVTIGSIITGLALLLVKAQSKIKQYLTVHCSSNINSSHNFKLFKYK